MKRFLLLCLLLPLVAAAQTTPIRNARITGASVITGTLSVRDAQIGPIQAESFATPTGWTWAEPAADTLSIGAPSGLRLDLIQQTSGSQDVLYFPGMVQAGAFTGDGTGITALTPAVVQSALSGAHPVYLDSAGAAQAANNMILLYADTSGGVTTYEWRSHTAAATATALGVGTTSAASFASVKVNNGSVLARLLTATATLDFPSVAAAGAQTLTVTVTGAALADSVVLGRPAAPPAGLIAEAWVSATNTVTVRLTNVTAAAIDPAAATYRVTVIGF